MARYDFDLFTIGAGSGGVRASRMSAGLGARVAVAEQSRLGGTCVNVGCVPKKLLYYAAELGESFTDAVGFGWSPGATSFDWPTLVANKDREIARLNGVYRNLLQTSGVTIVEGRARVVGPHTVAVGDRTYTAEHILVATGGSPWSPDIPGTDLAITSNEAFSLPELPRAIVIMGGGYIAVEFAGIFNSLGAEVTLLYRGPLFLRGFDDDIRTTLAEEMVKRGIDLRFEVTVRAMERSGEGLGVHLSTGERLAADQVLCAVGRVPNTFGLGLAEVGVELDARGAVVVDEYFASSLQGLYAIGDCIDRVQLTPVALAEGMALSRTLFAGEPTSVDYTDIPTAVFSQPNVGTVGLTETAARDALAHVEVYRSSFRPLKHTLSGRDERTMMKLVVDGDSGRVVGTHMVGAEAGEIIQGLAVALKCNATKAQLDATIGIHPTAAEEFVTMRTPVSQ
jgi:glutathione reductase (NADPH)